jgi:hypothetical protein
VSVSILRFLEMTQQSRSCGCPLCKAGRVVSDNKNAARLLDAHADAAHSTAQHSTHLHHASAASTATEASFAPMSCSSSVCRSAEVMKVMLIWLVAAQRTMGTSVDDTCAGGRSDATCGGSTAWHSTWNGRGQNELGGCAGHERNGDAQLLQRGMFSDADRQ